MAQLAAVHADEDDFTAAIARADQLKLRVQEHGGRRTFVATGAGYRVELHPPRDWLEDLLGNADVLSIAELQQELINSGEGNLQLPNEVPQVARPRRIAARRIG